MALVFESIHTEGIAQLSYLVGDSSTHTAAVIDPRPDCDVYLELARRHQLAITQIIETHMKRTLLITVSMLVTAVSAGALGETPQAREYSGPAWSPYLAGGLIGVLTWFTLLFSHKPVGASSGYATAAGLAGHAIAPKTTGRLKYYQDNPPRGDWELVFVGAIIVGAFFAAWHGGELTGRWLPPFWEARFGEGSLLLRAVVAAAGGALMAFGARMAGGCTSGHGISGTLQLNVASWIALICFFVGGIIVANLLYRI